MHRLPSLSTSPMACSCRPCTYCLLHSPPGDGQVAACMKPMVGGEFFAADLPQWMSLQEVLGVSKVLDGDVMKEDNG